MRVQRGDIVLLPIAFTTGAGSKYAPLPSIQSDPTFATSRLNPTTIVAPSITKATHSGRRSRSLDSAT